jgi:hypothetical protein
MPAIQHMPVEILHKILIFGCEIYEDPFLTGAFNNRRLYKPLYLSSLSANGFKCTREPQLKAFAEAPQYVCRFWKRIILETPGLWYIDYAFEGQLGDFDRMESAVDSSNVEIDLHLTRVSLIPLERAARSLTMLRRHRSRIRMINFIIPSGDQWRRYVELINSLEKLPNLEFLRIGVESSAGYSNTSFTPKALTSFELTVPMPALRIAAFTNLQYPPLQISPRLQVSQAGGIGENPQPSLWKSPNASMNPHLRCLDLDMLWNYPFPSNPAGLPTLNLPFLTGLRLNFWECFGALELLSRLNIPRVTSMVICCSQSGPHRCRIDANSGISIHAPLLEILRVGGNCFVAFSHRLKDALFAPNLRAVQLKEGILNQMGKSTIKVADVRGQFADRLALEDRSHSMGFVIELCQTGSVAHSPDHAVVSCCGAIALDLLGFFPRINISGLTIRGSPCCRTTNWFIVNYSVLMDPNEPLGIPSPRLRFICMADYRGDQLGPLSQPLFRHINSACLRAPESAAKLESLLEQCPAETLHFVLSPFHKIEFLKLFAQLDPDTTLTIRSRLFEWINPSVADPDTPKPRATVAPNLRHLCVTLKPRWIPDVLDVDEAALFDMLITIITARRRTNIPLESLTLERSLIPRFDKKLARHCERNTVRYSMGEIDCAAHCSAS